MAKRGGIAKRDVGKVVDRETSSETEHHDVRGSSESEGSGPSNAAIKTGGKHPKTILMIIEAIDELGQYQDLDEKRFKLLFKRALLKGITDGVLLRTKLTEQCEGVTGRFEVAPAKPKLARKPKDALAKSDKAPEFQAAGDVGKPSGSGLPKAAAAAKLQKKVAKKAEDAPESGAVKARVVRQHRQSALYEYKGGVPQAPKDVVKRMSLRKDAAAHEEGVQPRKVAEAGKKVVVPLRRQPARATKM
ncbi:histone H1, putative [Ixodes scapularis]|uniref:Histone H1, putative n=1 Tax=Ixodes scapularis TaxID=6945 RepID=B7Q1N4_IXOSC|nr:histone H1, putative [Ixodes scapularis]|eukprot:XP_002409848.1 histone H1, putative [Ixodes scapularis]